MLNTGDAEINKLSLCPHEVDILVQWLSFTFIDDIFGLHKEIRKPIVATILLFENMELNYSVYLSDLSQQFWVQNILFFTSFKRGLKNTGMCLESDIIFTSDKMN